jgi:hypothetical protein
MFIYAVCIQITLGKYSGKPEMLQPDIVRPVEDLSKVLVLEPQYRLTKGLTAKKLNFAIAGAIDEIEEAFAPLTDTKQTHYSKQDDNDRVAWIYDSSIDIPTTTGNAESSPGSNRDVITLAHIAHDIAADTATADSSNSNSNSNGNSKWPGECQFIILQLVVSSCCSSHN